jgi:hypothetical protein
LKLIVNYKHGEININLWLWLGDLCAVAKIAKILSQLNLANNQNHIWSCRIQHISIIKIYLYSGFRNIDISSFSYLKKTFELAKVWEKKQKQKRPKWKANQINTDIILLEKKWLHNFCEQSICGSKQESKCQYFEMCQNPEICISIKLFAGSYAHKQCRTVRLNKHGNAETQF